MYPIGRLISEAMKSQGMERKDLVKALGYVNLNKGRRNLDACLDGGDCSNYFLMKGLPRALGVDPAKVEEAAQLTRRQQAEEAEARERAQFRPHIYIEAKRTHPIFVVVLCSGYRSLYLDVPSDLPSLPEEEQIKRVGQMVREHYASTGGKAHLVGDIQLFVYRQTYEQSIIFNPEGEVVGRQDTPYKVGRYRLQIGNKTLEDGKIRPRDA
ncbi:MAG: hypothetical protein QHH30_01830 [candidate division NC10 bacterium]|nr:hypothetical protein [candidate division NC10 bacterium]